MSNPFDRGPQGIGDTFNPFIGKPLTNGPVPAVSFDKAKATKRDNTKKFINWLSELSPRSPKKDALLAELVADRPPEENELADVIDQLGRPDAITANLIIKTALGMGACLNIANWLCDRDNRRVIPIRMKAAGYVPVYNDARKIGLWVIGGTRQVVYAKRDLSLQERIRAAMTLKSESKADTGTRAPTAPGAPALMGE